MTKSEYIDLIARLIDEGNTFPAYHEQQGVCRYGIRGTQKACFIGILIPEDHPAKYTGFGVEELLQKWPELLDLMPGSMAEMQLCQSVHDVRRDFTSEGFKAHKSLILQSIKTYLKC